MFFREIYDMTTKMNFSSEFIRRLSPADRKIYIMYYKKELEEEENRKQKPSSPAPFMTNRLPNMEL